MSIGAAPELREVHIVGLPLAIWARAEEHADGLLREFALIAASEARGGEAHLPRHLLELIDELEADYAGLTVEQQSQLTDAASRGLDAIDLVYRVPPEILPACRRLGDALDAADRYCRDGEYLLTLATPPDALAFRRWYLGEFIRQIEGQPAQPWLDWVTEQGVSLRRARR
ncbi:MAG: hypothetical protein ACRDYZ_11195 [Acidimicrobiales bacterium]